MDNINKTHWSDFENKNFNQSEKKVGNRETEETHTHKKASWGILDKNTGKGPDKLLLFSLLVSHNMTKK